MIIYRWLWAFPPGFDGFSDFQDGQLFLKQETAAEITAAVATEEGERVEKNPGELSIPIEWPLNAYFSLYVTFDVGAKATESVNTTFTSEFGGLQDPYLCRWQVYRVRSRRRL